MASVSFKGNISYALYLGGIAGYLSSYSSSICVKNCANYGSVTHSGTSKYSYIGGVVGYSYNYLLYNYIYNCLNHGTITHSGTTPDYLYLGGIVGYTEYTYIENCASAGMISSSSTAKSNYIGSLVGEVYSYTYIKYCYYTDGLSSFNMYGRGISISISNTLSYNSNTFELNRTTSINKYTGTSLIGALNTASDYYVLRDYSRWLLNKNNKNVSFTINGRPNPIKMDFQIILLPSLASEGNMWFNGWYNDSKYESVFIAPEIVNGTSLYGKFEENINYYTITFNTRGGMFVGPISAQFRINASLPYNLTRDNCSVAFWETAYGDNYGFSLTMLAHNITLYAVWKCTHIKTPDDFLDFSKVVNSGTSNYSGTTVFLDSDLSLSGYSVNPIGTDYTYCFHGVFDGQGYVISNLNITCSSYYMGLFGYSNGLTIKNVVLDSSCSITNSYSGSNNIYVGGIIGYCSGQCNIENNVNMASVSFRGNITSKSRIAYLLYLGGIVGELSSYSNYVSTVKNCVNYGSVTYSGTSVYSYIGGVVGYLANSYYKYIYNCLNYGTITHSGTTSYSYLGGIVGHTKHAHIENCVSSGKISILSAAKYGNYIGSLVGSVDSGTYIDYCYYTDELNNFNMYEGGTPESTTGTSSSPVSVDSSLISNLNSQATIYSWNKWLLNLSKKAVTFKVNNNDGFSFLSKIILFPDLTSDSLVFSGWYADSLYTSIFSSSSVSSDITLYGGWLVVVIFNANGGSVPASKEVVFNNTYGDLSTPSRTGYSFVGWYTETPEGILVTNSTIVTIPYSHTLYAHWNPIKYTISFMSDGESACPNITQDYDTPITLPVLSKTGYTFVCWCNNTDLEFEYTAKTIESKNVTLYARWEANIYTVSFKEECKVSRSPVSVTYNNIYNISEPTSELGFLWWEIMETGQKVNVSIAKIAHNHTLCAVWKINTVTFNVSEGDDNLEPVNATYGKKYENLTNATRTGYTFVGWFFNESNTEPVTNNTDVTIPYPHTLYARWRINSYTAIFDLDNGENVVAKLFEYNSTIIYPDEPEKRGYTFSGWDNDTLEFMPAENITVKARWIPKNYTVTLDVNGGDELVNKETNVTFDSKYGDLPTPSRTGYAFVGWFTETPEGDFVTNSTAVTISYDHTLYAHWIPIQYTISFMSDEESACPNITQDYDIPITLPVLSKTGYTFICWCSDTKLEFEYTAKRIESKNVTLYARWVANDYTVSFDENGADDELVNKEMPVIFDSPYGALPTSLNKTGHTFAGWTDSLFGGNEINSSTTVSIPNNHTLYALWTVNQYTMTFVFENTESANITLNYNNLIIYPNENPSKSFHKFRRWCTRGENGEEECNVTYVPNHDLVFTASFNVDSSLVTGIAAVGVFAIILLIIIIIIILFLIRVTRTVKHKYEVVDIEMDEDLNERNDDVEERIKQQAEATSISTDIKKKLEKPLKKADKSKGVDEILMDLEVDCENAEDIDIIDSYRTTSASAVANAINNEKNLIAAAEYLTLLYTSVREQEEYEKFNGLYFGMKDVDDFMNSMDEKTICFDGIVSGFTSKKVAIKSLISKEEEEEANMPSGVLFRVQNGMGYKIGKVDKETDEVLFELCSSFKVESMKEINKDKYIVVNLSFVSPMTKDEMTKI